MRDTLAKLRHEHGDFDLCPLKLLSLFAVQVVHSDDQLAQLLCLSRLTGLRLEHAAESRGRLVCRKRSWLGVLFILLVLGLFALVAIVLLAFEHLADQVCDGVTSLLASLLATLLVIVRLARLRFRLIVCHVYHTQRRFRTGALWKRCIRRHLWRPLWRRARALWRHLWRGRSRRSRALGRPLIRLLWRRPRSSRLLWRSLPPRRLGWLLLWLLGVLEYQLHLLAWDGQLVLHRKLHHAGGKTNELECFLRRGEGAVSWRDAAEHHAQ